MAIRLPPNFRPGPVSDESGAGAVGSSDKEAGHGVHTIVYVFPPLDDPIDRHADVVGKRRFDARVNVYEVNWSWARGGQYAEVIAFRLGKEASLAMAPLVGAATRHATFATKGASISSGGKPVCMWQNVNYLSIFVF